MVNIRENSKTGSKPEGVGLPSSYNGARNLSYARVGTDNPPKPVSEGFSKMTTRQNLGPERQPFQKPGNTIPCGFQSMRGFGNLGLFLPPFRRLKFVLW